MNSPPSNNSVNRYQGRLQPSSARINPPLQNTSTFFAGQTQRLSGSGMITNPSSGTKKITKILLSTFTKTHTIGKQTRKTNFRGRVPLDLLNKIKLGNHQVLDASVPIMVSYEKQRKGSSVSRPLLVLLFISCVRNVRSGRGLPRSGRSWSRRSSAQTPRRPNRTSCPVPSPHADPATSGCRRFRRPNRWR